MGESAPLRALTFDFWGTLYRNASAEGPRVRLLSEVLVRHAQARSRRALVAAYRHAWSVVRRAWLEEHRSLSTERWLDEMLGFLSVDLPQDVVAGLCRPMEEVFLHGHMPRLVSGVRKVLPRLVRRYRLGLISDVGLTPGRVLRAVLQRDGLLPLFSVLTFSDDTGVTKPVPEVFLRTLTALETMPEEAAHIGDLPETDIVGAQAVGMRAVLFLGVSHREDGRACADAAFGDYTELEALLKRLESPTAAWAGKAPL